MDHSSFYLMHTVIHIVKCYVTLTVGEAYVIYDRRIVTEW
jgi:hypothetical protein